MTHLAAIPDILAEIAAAMRPKRQPDGQWNKVAEERAGNRIALLPAKIVVMLAGRVTTDVLAEVLAEIAVEERVHKDKNAAWLAYWARLAGWRRAA